MHITNSPLYHISQLLIKNSEANGPISTIYIIRSSFRPTLRKHCFTLNYSLLTTFLQGVRSKIPLKRKHARRVFAAGGVVKC